MNDAETGAKRRHLSYAVLVQTFSETIWEFVPYKYFGNSWRGVVFWPLWPPRASERICASERGVILGARF